jgi:hypothetical protein
MSQSRFTLYPPLLVVFLLTVPAQSGQWQDFSGVSDISVLSEGHTFSAGGGRDGVPALTNPEFHSAAEDEFFLDEDLVLGVYMHGVAKAYPEGLGWWHEIVNDEVGGQHISVTLCPLTGTGLNFNATDADGEGFEFGVSGLLMNSNLVMYDRRDDMTLYPQMIYTAFSGPRIGEELELLPIVETTWGMWKRMHPDTQIALPGTGLDRYPDRQATYADIDRYAFYPYRRYRVTGAINYPLTFEFPDLETIHAKSIVLGMSLNGMAKSYHFNDLPDGAIINDELGGDHFVVTFDQGSQTAIPYFSNVEGRELTFYTVEPNGELPVEFRDVETGTWWDMLGRGISGELAGSQLEQVPAHNAMWFAWDTYWRGAPIWNGEGIIEAPEDPITAVEGEDDGGRLPSQFALAQNYPNPFNPATHIQVSLPVRSTASLRIYDTLGQLVRTLMEASRRPVSICSTGMAGIKQVLRLPAEPTSIASKP